MRNGLPNRISDAIATGRRALSIWSAGCASGEEAYTLVAITLQAMLRADVAREQGDTLLPRAGWQLEVVGSDLSVDMIERAKLGVYPTAGLSPFRAMRDDYRRLFPVESPMSRQVRADLRGRVRFIHENLLEGPAPVAGADVVVCRNVLVYFVDFSASGGPGEVDGGACAGRLPAARPNGSTAAGRRVRRDMEFWTGYLSPPGRYAAAIALRSNPIVCPFVPSARR